MPEEFEGPGGADDFDVPPPFFPYEDRPERGHGSYGEPVEVEIEGVYAAEGSSNSRFILLSDGDRKLPIIIGAYEAHAILLPLEKARPDRPLTHDLLKTLIERLGATVSKVVIDDLWNTTYYAKVFIKKGKEEIEIDARPSDSIAIAVRFEAPIFVAEGILNQAMEE
jgi:hypothetical protein